MLKPPWLLPTAGPGVAMVGSPRQRQRREWGWLGSLHPDEPPSASVGGRNPGSDHSRVSHTLVPSPPRPAGLCQSRCPQPRPPGLGAERYVEREEGLYMFIRVQGDSPAHLPAGARLCEWQSPNTVHPINLFRTLLINIWEGAGRAALPGEMPASPSGGTAQTLGMAGLARPAGVLGMKALARAPQQIGAICLAPQPVARLVRGDKGLPGGGRRRCWHGTEVPACPPCCLLAAHGSVLGCWEWDGTLGPVACWPWAPIFFHPALPWGSQPPGTARRSSVQHRALSPPPH